MFSPRQRVMGHVVVDADGEVILLFARHVVEDGLELGRGGVLGRETVAAAQQGEAAAGLVERRAYVLEERLAQGAGLLGAVEGGERPAGLGDGGEEVLQGEGTEEVDLDHADLLALFVEIVHHFVQGLADRAHGHHDALGVRSAIIIKKLIVASGELGHLLHILFHHGREGVVGLVHALAELEADVVRAG